MYKGTVSLNYTWLLFDILSRPDNVRKTEALITLLYAAHGLKASKLYLKAAFHKKFLLSSHSSIKITISEYLGVESAVVIAPAKEVKYAKKWRANSMSKKQKELLVSGYGPVGGEPSVKLWEMSDDYKVENTIWREHIKEPSYLCTWKDMCFGIREEKESGSVLCYQRIGETYVLRHELELQGGDLCHILYEPGESVLYCSFYGTGHVAAVKVEDYRFTTILNFFKLPANPESGIARAHCCEKEPQGSYVLFAGIAQDKVFVFQTEGGKILSELPAAEIDLNKDAGPRHLKFHPILNFLYVITEYSNEIYVYLFEKKEGEPLFTRIQVISTLPELFRGVSYGSGLAISKDGRFLYAANRGADSIAVFDINPDGLLTKKQDISCKGEHPRHIALTKDDKCLMIANQKSNQVVFYAVDEMTGRLKDVIQRMDFNNPSYVEEV